LPPKILVITGPTATGKTALGVRLAELLDGEVVSADSMQIYAHMDIGTAKPTPSETRGVPHHLMGYVSPFETYSVARYVQDAAVCIDGILARGRLPIVVGGTNLYIDSLLSGRDFAGGEIGGRFRTELSARYDANGGEKMLAELAAFDPDSAAKLKPNDKKRIVRAFEVYQETGQTITQHNLETQKRPPRYDACKIALNYADRQALYDRINRRVDDMMARGLLKEVTELLAMGLTPDHTAMQAIGYKELAAALSGRCTTAEAVEKIKQESRRYAKRQLSWLRRDGSVFWIIWGKEPDISSAVRDSTRFLEKFGYNGAVHKPFDSGGMQ
jgi:tRNA dimethylallyltransferase